MDIIRRLDEHLWREFVDNNPQGRIFHTPEMFQVFANATNHKPELWAVTNGDEQVLALLLPVRLALMDGLLRYFTTRSVVYGGILYASDSVRENALMLLLQTYAQEVGISLFTELRHQTDSQCLQPVLQQCSYKFEEHDNYLINLALPVEQVWGNISKSARKKIRQAENKNMLVIEELHDHDKLSNWYALLQKTYKAARIPLADYSLFEAAFDVLYPKGMIQFLLGRVQDKYVAASVALLYKDIIYGWYRGFDREYGSYLPNDLMVWHLLKWGAENGYRVFDFGGAGKSGANYGPRQFKAKFGGELVSYGRSVCVHRPMTLKLSELSYQFYRRFLYKLSESEQIGSTKESDE
jgi:serine/alanine adding enzyme